MKEASVRTSMIVQTPSIFLNADSNSLRQIDGIVPPIVRSKLFRKLGKFASVTVSPRRLARFRFRG